MKVAAIQMVSGTQRDDNLGAAAVVVILGADGQVLQKQATTVGG